MPLNLNVGDTVELKKQHACGCKEFQIIRVGMDIKIKFKTNFGKHYLQEEKHGRLYHGTGCGDYQQPLYPV